MFYDYQCETCEHKEEFEFELKADKPKMIECPKCHGPMLRVYAVNTIIPDHMKATGDPEWTNRYHKFPSGMRGKMNQGGGVKDFN